MSATFSLVCGFFRTGTGTACLCGFAACLITARRQECLCYKGRCLCYWLFLRGAIVADYGAALHYEFYGFEDGDVG